MSIALHIGLGRLRIALLIAGLAWFAGITPGLIVRVALAGLVVCALVFDGVIDDHRIARAAVGATKAPPNDYHTAA